MRGTEEVADPLCAATLEAAARAPSLTSHGAAFAEALTRNEEADRVRLAARACPLGWVMALETADAALARSVAARCADAEAVLAVACRGAGALAVDDAAVVMDWASRHPVAREDDAPAIEHAKRLLGKREGGEAAAAALARVSYPTR